MSSSTMSFLTILQSIQQDPMNRQYTAQGIQPLYCASANAKILIIGQAPGRIAEESQLYWNDPSGDTLRQWLNVSRETFYNPDIFAILPMDFYFPGKGKSGDLPPRTGFAEKWHPPLLDLMPNLQLKIVVGSYANRAYLAQKPTETLTKIVQNYQQYLPEYFPLVHPSPRNRIWQKRNPWFIAEVVPALQTVLHAIL